MPGADDLVRSIASSAGLHKTPRPWVVSPRALLHNAFMTMILRMDSVRTLVGTSWKMTKSRAGADAFAEALRTSDEIPSEVELFVLPPFPFVEAVARILSATPVRVGAQNVHWEDSGPFTGEVSAPMLAEVGATVVEVGHSERRQLFGETDDTVRMKVAAAQRHGLTPVVCVGEPWAVRESGQAVRHVTASVRAALADARPDVELWIAYEPVWAIGENGRAATPEQAEEIHAAIRATCVEVLAAAGTRIPLLYGGSVTADNAAGYLSAPSVDGLFVGRAAWTVQGLLDIVRVAAATSRPPA